MYSLRCSISRRLQRRPSGASAAFSRSRGCAAHLAAEGCKDESRFNETVDEDVGHHAGGDAATGYNINNGQCGAQCYGGANGGREASTKQSPDVVGDAKAIPEKTSSNIPAATAIKIARNLRLEARNRWSRTEGRRALR